MRWIVVWLLLTGIYLAGQLALLGGGEYGHEELLHLLTVPLAQTAALWVVALVRRHSRK